MLAKRERIIWLAAIVTSMVVTYVLTISNGVPPKSTYVSATLQSSPSQIEHEADQWFSNTDGPMPPRYVYSSVENLDAPRLLYESGLKQGAPWANYPEQIALYTFRAPPEIEGYAPSAISVYYGERNANMAGVIITDIRPFSLGAYETRIDFVKVNNRWSMVWAGDRSISPRYP